MTQINFRVNFQIIEYSNSQSVWNRLATLVVTCDQYLILILDLPGLKYYENLQDVTNFETAQLDYSKN